MATVTKRARTNAVKPVAITLRPGRWFTTRNGKLVKILSTRGAGNSYPVVAGLYDSKKNRLVAIQNFSARGVIQGGNKIAPLNIVGTAPTPKVFSSVEKNFSFSVNL